MSAAYAPSPWLTHPFGALRRVAIPDEDPPPEALGRLHPDEQAFAAGLASARRRTWVAGRIALAAALAEVGAPCEPLLATARGAPRVPAGFVGSVSHKRRVAAALAGVDEGARIGVDVEEAAPARTDVSGHVLTAGEVAELGALAPDDRWRGVIPRFSIKEAIYKALDPFVQRYVGFKEVTVDLGGDEAVEGFGGAGAGGAGPGGPLRGTPSGAPPNVTEGFRQASVRLDLAKGEGPFAVEVAWAETEGLFVSVARVRRS